MTEPRLEHFRKTVQRHIDLPCLIYPPLARADAPSALIVHLHGAGEKGDMDRLRGACLPRLMAEGLNVGNAYVACPLCPATRSGWPVDHLAALVDHLLATLPVDPARIGMTGISMGGRGTWDFAYDHGDRLAAIAPVCGFGIPTLAPRLSRLPSWIWHGQDDDIVPVHHAQAMHAALTRIGAPCRYTQFPNTGHACGRQVYTTPALWNWLINPHERHSLHAEG